MPLRKSTRGHKPPEYLKDYYYHTVHAPLRIIVPAYALSQTHYALLSHISQYTEPKTYEEASHNPSWVEAMNKEIYALRVPFKKSTRGHKPLEYLKDYYYHIVHAPLRTIVPAYTLSQTHYALLSHISQYTEPKTYDEA